MTCFRTLTKDVFDNVVNSKSNTTEKFIEKNLLDKKPNFTEVTVTTGRLSQRIKTNLKASADFYVRSNTENLSDVIGNSCKENYAAPIDIERTVKDKVSTEPTWTLFHHLNNKITLDKYFNVTKSRWRPQVPTPDRCIATATENHLTKSSVNCGNDGQLHSQQETNFIMGKKLYLNRK